MSDKVVSLNKKREEKEKEITVKPETNETAFAEIVRKNKEKAERMKKEREKENKGVIRSYRLKH